MMTRQVHLRRLGGTYEKATFFLDGSKKKNLWNLLVGSFENLKLCHAYGRFGNMASVHCKSFRYQRAGYATFESAGRGKCCHTVSIREFPHTL
jgi:hypothetical protein